MFAKMLFPQIPPKEVKEEKPPKRGCLAGCALLCLGVLFLTLVSVGIGIFLGATAWVGTGTYHFLARLF